MNHIFTKKPSYKNCWKVIFIYFVGKVTTGSYERSTRETQNETRFSSERNSSIGKFQDRRNSRIKQKREWI